MTTDDKRNEIAAKLRKAASENNVDIACALNDALRGETKQRGVNEDCKNCASATLREIADLIEPQAERTCRPEVCDDGAGAWGVYCSECCYRFVGPYGSRDLPERMAARRDIMPHYCSNCGARVVVE